MATLYTEQSKNIRKTWFLMTFFLVIVIAAGYGVSWYFGNPVIVYFAVAVALLVNIFSYWQSDKIVIRMTGAKKIVKADAPDLYNLVENLSITAGLPMPRVYLIDDSAPNAFATGRNQDCAAVAVTTGLLKRLDRAELEGVIAHELAHIGNRDILVMTIAVILAGFIAILADFFMRALWFGGDRDRHPIFLVVAIIGIILAPLAAQMVKMAISRKREYLADASGALLTRYPSGLASALEKISSYQGPMKRTSHATAHLFIHCPFGGSQVKKGLAKSIGNLFNTHPPAEDRIARLKQLDT